LAHFIAKDQEFGFNSGTYHGQGEESYRHRYRDAQ